MREGGAEEGETGRERKVVRDRGARAREEQWVRVKV